MIAIRLHPELSINLYPKGVIHGDYLYIDKDKWDEWMRLNQPTRSEYVGYLRRRRR